MDLPEHVISLERAALDRWITADPDGYLDLYADDATYFDPFREKRVDGLDEHNARMAPMRGMSLPFTEPRYEMIEPVVHVDRNVAVLTFNLVNYRKPSGSAKCEAALAQDVLISISPVEFTTTGTGQRESDNVGTRYETQEQVQNFWAPYFFNRPAFPFVFYDFAERKDIMDAMLSLEPIKIASDSGKLISTEILHFGVYPVTVNGSWYFFLAGNQINITLYNAPITSCKKYNGMNPRIGDPPKDAPTYSAALSTDIRNSVTFDWEEKVYILR